MSTKKAAAPAEKKAAPAAGAEKKSPAAKPAAAAAGAEKKAPAAKPAAAKPAAAAGAEKKTPAAKPAAAKPAAAKPAAAKPAAAKPAAAKPATEKKAESADKKAPKKKKKQHTVDLNRKKHQPIRLYTRATFVGFRRNLGTQNNNHHLLKLEGVKTREDSDFYMGKRVAYIYKARRLIEGKRFRVVWGRIQRPHGNSGVVRASFRRNLPSRAMGSQLRVMLYPSRV